MSFHNVPKLKPYSRSVSIIGVGATPFVRILDDPAVDGLTEAELFAYAARCELDSQGRALIPQHLRDYAGFSKNVTVLGCNNHAELWDSEAWSAVYAAETSPENIAAVMEELDF